MKARLEALYEEVKNNIVKGNYKVESTCPGYSWIRISMDGINLTIDEHGYARISNEQKIEEAKNLYTEVKKVAETISELEKELEEKKRSLLDNINTAPKSSEEEA